MRVYLHNRQMLTRVNLWLLRVTGPMVMVGLVGARTRLYAYFS
jgi:hypothetical protein